MEPVDRIKINFQRSNFYTLAGLTLAIITLFLLAVPIKSPYYLVLILLSFIGMAKMLAMGTLLRIRTERFRRETLEKQNLESL